MPIFVLVQLLKSTRINLEQIFGDTRYLICRHRVLIRLIHDYGCLNTGVHISLPSVIILDFSESTDLIFSIQVSSVNLMVDVV